MKQSRRNFLKKSTIGTVASAAGLVSLAGMACTGAPSATDDKNTYRLTRQIPVDKEYDVIVAGGGPGGVGAAVCAAREGAKVLLIEATGCLGGMGTSGLVTAFDPMADGENMLAGGFMLEILLKMHQRGFLAPGKDPKVFMKEYGHWTHFHAEGYKLVLDELATDAGVELRFFTRVIEADAHAGNGIVNGIVQQNIEGLRYVKAKTFIDCTGDAVLADLCGAKCNEAGIDTPDIMAASLCSYYANIDFSQKGNPGTNSPILLKAIEDGHFTQPDKHLPGLRQVGETIGHLNGGHLFGVDALNCKSLSEGMMWGRRMAQEYLSFYRKYVPGFENMEQVATASVMGVRESRRIVGEYELNFNDYLDRREFADQIGVHNKAVDIHALNSSDEEFQRHIEEYKIARYKPGEYSGIPYSILVPKGWKNLWIAGRCNSSDLKVHGAIRAQATCNIMGQAAGTAAVQSINTGQPACDLNTETLVITLRNNGAFLPQKTLSPKMTRV